MQSLVELVRFVRLTVSQVGGTHLCEGGMPLPPGVGLGEGKAVFATHFYKR